MAHFLVSVFSLCCFLTPLFANPEEDPSQNTPTPKQEIIKKGFCNYSLKALFIATAGAVWIVTEHKQQKQINEQQDKILRLENQLAVKQQLALVRGGGADADRILASLVADYAKLPPAESEQAIKDVFNEIFTSFSQKDAEALIPKILPQIPLETRLARLQDLFEKDPTSGTWHYELTRNLAEGWKEATTKKDKRLKTSIRVATAKAWDASIAAAKNGRSPYTLWNWSFLMAFQSLPVPMRAAQDLEPIVMERMTNSQNADEKTALMELFSFGHTPKEIELLKKEVLSKDPMAVNSSALTALKEITDYAYLSDGPHALNKELDEWLGDSLPKLNSALRMDAVDALLEKKTRVVAKGLTQMLTDMKDDQLDFKNGDFTHALLILDQILQEEPQALDRNALSKIASRFGDKVLYPKEFITPGGDFFPADDPRYKDLRANLMRFLSSPDTNPKN